MWSRNCRRRWPVSARWRTCCVRPDPAEGPARVAPPAGVGCRAGNGGIRWRAYVRAPPYNRVDVRGMCDRGDGGRKRSALVAAGATPDVADAAALASRHGGAGRPRLSRRIGRPERLYKAGAPRGRTARRAALAVARALYDCDEPARMRAARAFLCEPELRCSAPRLTALSMVLWRRTCSASAACAS